MENNQEHKIDKIFKESIENQSVVPPSDAWTAVHTYTAGQEEKKPKVWLKYASLALLFLLISGLGVWYFVDNQKIVNDKLVVENTLKIVSKMVIVENARNTGTSSVRTQTTAHTVPLEKAGRQLHCGLNPASVKTLRKIIHSDNQLGGLQLSSAERVIQLPHLLKNEKFVNLKSTEKEPLIVEIVEDSLINDNIEFIEPVSYFSANKIVEIEYKPLILNDLSDKIKRESKSNIVFLDNSIVNNRETFKIDSVNYGQKLSLKHPIISYGFGQIWNFWDMGENNFDKVVFPNERGANIQFAIAWKLNKKMRAGLTFELNGYNLGIAAISLPPWSSSIGIPTLRLIRENQVYRSELPFGNVEIPVAYFQNAPTSIPNQLDTIRRISFSPHSMRTSSISLNFKYDLFSKLKGKKKIFNYQIYSLSDLVIQRQTSYSFVANDYYSTTSSTKPINTITVLFFDTNRLQNASEFVFGLRAGLGFRYQFARKWDFYVEGSGQHSLNNWVKSDKIKTFQRALSLQAGINLNL